MSKFFVEPGESFDQAIDPQRAFGNLMETAGVHAQCAIEGSSEALAYQILPEFTLPNGEVLRNVPTFGSETPSPRLLVHNCDTTGESSGSAILALFEGGYSVIDIHAG